MHISLIASNQSQTGTDHLSLNQENSKLTSLATTLREGTSVPLDNVHIGFEFEVVGMNTIFEARSRWEQLSRMETAGENLRTTFSKTVELSSAYALLDEEKNPGLAKIDSLNMKFSTRQVIRTFVTGFGLMESNFCFYHLKKKSQ